MRNSLITTHCQPTFINIVHREYTVDYISNIQCHTSDRRQFRTINSLVYNRSAVKNFGTSQTKGREYSTANKHTKLTVYSLAIQLTQE